MRGKNLIPAPLTARQCAGSVGAAQIKAPVAVRPHAALLRMW
jgi:hypothetical protein